METKKAEYLRVDKKRRAETEATINQRTFIMCKRQMMTGRVNTLYYFKHTEKSGM